MKSSVATTEKRRRASVEADDHRIWFLLVLLFFACGFV